MMIRKTAAAMFLGSSVFVTGAFGQAAQPTRPGVQIQVNPSRQGQPQQAAGQPQVLVTQQSMAACLAIANQEEISLAEIAADKAKSDDVKDFAKTVIDDHQAFLKKLQKFTPEARRDSLDQTTSNGSQVNQAGGPQSRPDRPVQQTAGQQQPRQQQPATQQQPTAQQQPATHQATAVDMIQLHREMAQQCLADSKKRMAKEEGDKFDACFIGHQIGKHEAMKTTLTVLQRHSSGEFAQLLADGLETTEEHLKQAEKIMNGLRDEKSDQRVTSDK